MKLCSICGCMNKDENTHCVDCGQRLFLGSLQQDKEASEKYSDFTKLVKEHAYFHVSLYHKIMAVLCAASFVVGVVVAIQDMRFLSLIVYCGLLAASGILEALFPVLCWRMEKWRLSYFIDDVDKAQPSTRHVLERKIAPAAFLLMNVAGVAAVLIAK